MYMKIFNNYVGCSMFMSLGLTKCHEKIMNPRIKFLIMFKGNNDKSETYL